LPHILGAENEVRDAVTNLLLNSVDALPEGGNITLRTRTDMSDDHVIIEVQDGRRGHERNHAQPLPRAVLHHQG
jgi:signal transduction histidine kinase